MTAEVRAAEGLVFDLSDRVKLRISGADRVRYLNGQISNDLRKATESFAIHACVLNAKGKMNADVFIVAEADSFLIDSEAATRDQLAARLDRYVIADDVQIEDVTEEFALFHVIGGDAPVLAGVVKSAQATRLGSSGTDLWVKRDARDAAFHALAATLSVIDETTADVLRIERGVPWWGHELTEEIIPTEANLEAEAIDYGKGCYIGQEVISRIKMSGQTNKRLCGLVSVFDVPLLQGMRLTTKGAEGKDLGWLTSATRSRNLNKEIALGYVKRGYNAVGSELDALAPENPFGNAAVRVKVVPLPFV